MEPDIDIEIKSISRRASAGGSWVRGILNDGQQPYHFSVLLFPQHAQVKSWELNNSKISKLFIKRKADGQVVFNWDRGADVDAADETTKALVSFLCSGLADLIYSGEQDGNQ